MRASTLISPSAGHRVGRDRVTVAISDYGVCNDPQAWLSTYALGSCIAILLHHPRRSIGGLLHFMLPRSELNPDKAAARPGMFADTGFAKLTEMLEQEHVQVRDMVASLVGGGCLQGLQVHMNIGRDNILTAKRLLREAHVTVAAEDVGGNRSRSAFLHVGTGRVVVRGPAGEYEL